MVSKHHFYCLGVLLKALTPPPSHQYSKHIPGLIRNMTASCCDLPLPEQACCAEEEVSVGLRSHSLHRNAGEVGKEAAGTTGHAIAFLQYLKPAHRNSEDSGGGLFPWIQKSSFLT